MKTTLNTSLLLISLTMLALTGPLITPVQSNEHKAEDLEEIVGYLLDYVAKSECVFIRNGKEHSSEKAVEHIRKKYEHYKEKIETPEDFIRLAATKSMMSGRPYLVRLEEGSEIHCAEWLTAELSAYRTRVDSLLKVTVPMDSIESKN